MTKEIAVPIIGILLFILLNMIIGILPYGKKRIDGMNSFHLATGSIGTPLTILCLMAALYTSSTWTGWVAFTRETGSFSVYVMIYIGVTGILYYFFSSRVYPVAKEKQMKTLGEYLENQYGSPQVKYAAGIISLLTGIIWITMEITTLGFIVNVAFGSQLPKPVCYLVGLLIILVYVLWGGLDSVIWTDCFQGSILIIGGIIMCLVLLNDNFDSLSQLTDAFLSNNSNAVISEYVPGGTAMYNSRTWISYILLCSLGCICLPQIFPRMFMGKNVNVQKKTGIAISLSGIWCLSFILIGMVATLALPGLDPQTSIFVLSKNTGNIYFVTLVYIVLIAAAMGTLDIALLSMSTIIISDFMSGFFKKNTAVNFVKISRITIIIVSVFCFAFANFYDRTLINLAFLSYGYISQLFPALVFGIYRKNKNTKAALAGITAGIIFATLFDFLNVDFYGITAGLSALIVNFVILAVGNFVVRTEAEPPARNGFSG